MDHQTATEKQITERYLLNELSESDREQFEEHFFSCADCARDVQSGAAFVEGIASFDAPAKAKEVFALCGVSSCPALSAAVTRGASLLK